MSPDTITVSDPPFDSRAAAPLQVTRPMYWSVRRELWENRSIYIAPLIVAAVVLFATLVNTAVKAPDRMRQLPSTSEERQRTTLLRPFKIAPAPIMVATIIVGLFYSLDALYGERRDRSILFWKSLPVSDATTVLSKMSIPLVVLPAIGLTLSAFAQVMILAQHTTILLLHGISPWPVWRELNFVPGVFVMVYGLAVHALWFAPMYAWLLLVSAWARRTPFLWALLPLFVVGVAERLMFGSTHFVRFLKYRWTGAMPVAFQNKLQARGDSPMIDGIADLTPLRFLSTPGLWLGLIFAAVCVAAAIRLRRSREPI